MSVIHTPGQPAMNLRVLLFPVVIFILLLILFLRLWYIQVVMSPELTERAEVFGKTYRKVPAPRGVIFDRNGNVVAGVQSQLVLMAEPATVMSNPWVVEKVADLLRQSGVKAVDPDRLMRRAKDGSYKPYVPTPIFSGVPVDVAAKIVESGSALPGIEVESRPTRFYPDTKSFSHLLGYVWVPSPSDIDRAKRERREASAFVGKGGVEWVYERDLMGVDGNEGMLVDRKGKPLRVVERDGALPGSQIILSIDARLQRTAIAALGPHRGAVVALDPRNGEILCMASTPTFDLNLFRSGISHADFDALNNRPDHPFINRAVGSAFAPGSAFKIVTTVAAMRAGVFNPLSTTFCGGSYRLGRQSFRCLGTHGNIAYDEALVRSCNTYFADLAMRVGKDTLRQTALDMGCFAKTGVDLPFERTGLIPTDDWLKRAKRRWVPGYTVLTGIGQGDVLTTPLQMANLAAMVANQGVTYRTHLVRGFRRGLNADVQLVQPQVLKSVDLPPEHWDTIQRAMVGVVQRGTAAGSRIEGLEWAGKTGSAEVYGQARTNSWFIAYAPAQNPRIALCVMVEAVGHGSDFAAPIAKKVIERYLLPPRDDSSAARASSDHLTPSESPAAR